MLYSRRKKFEKENKTVGAVFSRLGLSPNQWTFLSVLLAIATAYFVATQQFLLGAAFFAATAVFDIIDGSVARHTGSASKKGAYLDTMTDRYAEFIVIAGLFFAGLPPLVLPLAFWLFVYLFGSMMTTYAKAAAREKDLVKQETRGGGVLERSERMILLFVGLMAAHFMGTIYLTYTIVILAILSNITVFQRASSAMKKGR